MQTQKNISWTLSNGFKSWQNCIPLVSSLSRSFRKNAVSSRCSYSAAVIVQEADSLRLSSIHLVVYGHAPRAQTISCENPTSSLGEKQICSVLVCCRTGLKQSHQEKVRASRSLSRRAGGSLPFRLNSIEAARSLGYCLHLCPTG